MNETWMSVKGYEGLYEVSDFGRVRSLDRLQFIDGKRGKYARPVRGKVLSGSLVGSGYLCVGLGRNGVIANEYIHRLVASVFIDNSDDKPQVNHKNGNKSDDRAENLEWVTHQENAQHAGATGLLAIGDRNTSTKLQVMDVRIIRKRIARGHKIAQIALDFGVHKNTIRLIKDGHNWKHIS